MTSETSETSVVYVHTQILRKMEPIFNEAILFFKTAWYNAQSLEEVA